MYQIAVFEDFGEQKTVLEIHEATTSWLIDVVQLSKPRTYSRRRVDSNKGLPCPVPIDLLPCRSVCVIETFNNLGSKDVIGICVPKPGFAIKIRLICGRWLVGSVLCGAALVFLKGLFTWRFHESLQRYS